MENTTVRNIFLIGGKEVTITMENYAGSVSISLEASDGTLIEVMVNDTGSGEFVMTLPSLAADTYTIRVHSDPEGYADFL